MLSNSSLGKFRGINDLTLSDVTLITPRVNSILTSYASDVRPHLLLIFLEMVKNPFSVDGRSRCNKKCFRVKLFKDLRCSKH